MSQTRPGKGGLQQLDGCAGFLKWFDADHLPLPFSDITNL
jgi:hypothetical protein